MVRKLRVNKTVVLAGLGGAILVMSSIIATSTIYSNKIKDQRTQFEMVIQQKDGELSKYQLSSRRGYVFTRDIEAGETIKASDIELTDLPDYFVPTDVLSDPGSVEGKVLKINAKAQTAITSSMVYQEGPLDPTERKVELDYVKLPIKLQPKDKIDIRIVFPNGEDYLILSKKKMESMDLANQLLFLNLDIEELHLMDSALVDAYINKGEIYAIQYVEPEMQEVAPVSYFPNLDVLRVIKSDPRIADKARYSVADAVRKSFDQRMKAIPEEEKIRLGAELPSGSAVGKRRQTTGAQITVTPNTTENNTANNGAEGSEENNMPEGFVPPPEEGDTDDAEGQTEGIGDN